MTAALAMSLGQLQARLSRNHLAAWMELSITSAAAGQIVLSAPWREEFISNPEHRFAHGGILATLLDTAGSYAVATRLGRPPQTVDMRVDYLRPAYEATLTVEANIFHYGRTLATVDARVSDPGDNTLAVGRIVFLTADQRAAQQVS